MSRAHKILWGEGMFLRPQHFQQYDLYWEKRLTGVMHTACPHPWGLIGAKLDLDSLKSGILRLSQLAVVFQDGTPFDAPHSEPLPPLRHLNDIPQAGLDAIVHACLPDVNAFGGNVANQSDPIAAGRPARYASDRVQAPDLYTQSLESELSVLQANVSLMLEGERRDGHFSVPIARLMKDASGVWQLDENYVPPLFQWGDNARLEDIIQRLLDILELKSRSLAAAHRERTRSVVEFGTSDIASFWLLHTVNRAFPVLKHLRQDKRAHPTVLYQQLAQLCGELMTFSSTLSLRDIPDYAHENLGHTFQTLYTLARQLLETVISSRYVHIPLSSPKACFFNGRIESDNLLENADFYLSVASEAPAAQILEAIPHKLKVGSPDDVEKILNSALAGVILSHVAQVPSAIPIRVGNHYFALEPKGAIFERMLKSRSICIYTPKTLPDITMELYAVIR